LINDLLVKSQLCFDALVELVVISILPVAEICKRDILLGQGDNFLAEARFEVHAAAFDRYGAHFETVFDRIEDLMKALECDLGPVEEEMHDSRATGEEVAELLNDFVVNSGIFTQIERLKPYILLRDLLYE